MVLVIGKGSIEEKVKHEKETRRMIREQEDRLFHGKVFGRSKDIPARGDYKLCREGDKFLTAYKNAKSAEDRKKISAEYHQMQAEGRKYGAPKH